MGKIEMLCELLPADTNWGDLLTPQIVEENLVFRILQRHQWNGEKE